MRFSSDVRARAVDNERRPPFAFALQIHGSCEQPLIVPLHSAVAALLVEVEQRQPLVLARIAGYPPSRRFSGSVCPSSRPWDFRRVHYELAT